MASDATEPGSFAQRYESVLVPVIFVPWAKEMVRRGAPCDGEDILDLACGTGIVTRQVAASGVRSGSLTGVDHNGDMLEVARRTTEGSVPDVRWVEADAGHLPFEGGQFDLVFCQQALQFFPDRAAALGEVQRVLKDGGRTVFCVQRELAVNPMLAAQAATLDKHVGPSAGDAVRAICGLPDAVTIANLFDGAGFRDVAVESVSLSLHHPNGRAFAAGAMGGMHTGDKLSSLDQSRVEAAVDDFLAALGPHYDGVALNFPHVSNVVTARS